MNSNDLNIFIALILIKKSKSFRDSYSLTKVLSWKFDVISIVEITQQLKTNELVKEIFENRTKFYEITDKGSAYVEANMSKGKAILANKYKDQHKFINALFR